MYSRKLINKSKANSRKRVNNKHSRFIARNSVLPIVIPTSFTNSEKILEQSNKELLKLMKNMKKKQTNLLIQQSNLGNPINNKSKKTKSALSGWRKTINLLEECKKKLDNTERGFEEYSRCMKKILPKK